MGDNVHYRRGGLAQLGEHLPYKQGVAGSSPAFSTIFIKYNHRGVEQRATASDE